MCKRLNSKEELLSLYENVKGLLTLRDNESESTEKYYISVCGGTGCNSSQSPEIVNELKRWAKECGVEDKVIFYGNWASFRRPNCAL